MGGAGESVECGGAGAGVEPLRREGGGDATIVVLAARARLGAVAAVEAGVQLLAVLLPLRG